MKQSHGWWIPEHEIHLPSWWSHPKNRDDIADGRTMYQGKKLRAALGLCKSFRVAVDCGAHCGTWNFYLAQKFAFVHAFEPVAEHRECFARNVVAPNVTLHACAIGDREGSISMHTTVGSSGDSWIDGEGDIPLHTLDSFNLADVDLIKIDTEGFEESVIRGATETILRCKPVMVVEQKGHGKRHFDDVTDDLGAVKLLRAMGMVELCAPMSGDHVMGWPNA